MNHKSILDPSFRYVSSAATDLRKTFRRIRREQDAKQRADAQAELALVTPKTIMLRRIA